MHAKTMKWIALFLSCMLLLSLFAACAAEQPGGDADPNGGAGTGQDPAAQPGGEQQQETPESLIFEDGRIVDLSMYYFDLRMTGADHGERVTEAINAYLEPTYGLHVEIQYLTIGDWLSKVQMAISGGERVDLMPLLFNNSLANMTANSMLQDITELAAEYAPDALQVMEPYMDCFYINGRLFGIPTLKNWIGNGYIIMRKDILEELDMVEKAENLSSWSELEEILAAVYERYQGTGLYPLSKSAGRSILTANGGLTHGDRFDDYETWDTLGDTASVVHTDESGNVGLYQEQPAFAEELLMVRRWSENSWIWPDSALNDTHGDELIKQKVAFCNMQSSEIGVEVTKGASVGFELVCPKYYKGMLTSGSIVSWGVGVPVTAEEPEAALHLINALYTDGKLMDLLTWGVEHEDYELVDGQVQAVDGPHYYEADFIIGDNTLLTPLYGNGADHYTRVLEDIEGAVRSSYMGFLLDKSQLDLQISQLTAVNDQYMATLACGGYTEELYQEYLQKLEAAGVRDYLAEVQRQLDAWMAAQ